jgi:hypothetical protein
MQLFEFNFLLTHSPPDFTFWRLNKIKQTFSADGRNESNYLNPERNGQFWRPALTWEDSIEINFKENV